MGRKFSLLTTNPNEKKDKKLFWDYKVNQMWDQLIIFLVYNGVIEVMIILSAIFHSTQIMWSNVVLWSIYTALSVSIWFIGKRFKSAFVYLFFIFYFVSQLIGFVYISTVTSNENLGIQ